MVLFITCIHQNNPFAYSSGPENNFPLFHNLFILCITFIHLCDLWSYSSLVFIITMRLYLSGEEMTMIEWCFSDFSSYSSPLFISSVSSGCIHHLYSSRQCISLLIWASKAFFLFYFIHLIHHLYSSPLCSMVLFITFIRHYNVFAYSSGHQNPCNFFFFFIFCRFYSSDLC